MPSYEILKDEHAPGAMRVRRTSDLPKERVIIDGKDVTDIKKEADGYPRYQKLSRYTLPHKQSEPNGVWTYSGNGSESGHQEELNAWKGVPCDKDGNPLPSSVTEAPKQDDPYPRYQRLNFSHFVYRKAGPNQKWVYDENSKRDVPSLYQSNLDQEEGIRCDKNGTPLSAPAPKPEPKPATVTRGTFRDTITLGNGETFFREKGESSWRHSSGGSAVGAIVQGQLDKIAMAAPSAAIDPKPIFETRVGYQYIGIGRKKYSRGEKSFVWRDVWGEKDVTDSDLHKTLSDLWTLNHPPKAPDPVPPSKPAPDIEFKYDEISKDWIWIDRNESLAVWNFASHKMPAGIRFAQDLPKPQVEKPKRAIEVKKMYGRWCWRPKGAHENDQWVDLSLQAPDGLAGMTVWEPEAPKPAPERKPPTVEFAIRESAVGGGQEWHVKSTYFDVNGQERPGVWLPVRAYQERDMELPGNVKFRTPLPAKPTEPVKKRATAGCPCPDCNPNQGEIGMGIVFIMIMAICVAFGIGLGVGSSGDKDGSPTRTTITVDTHSRDKASVIRDLPVTVGKNEKCSPDQVQLGFRNNSSQAIGKVEYELRGYVKNRSTNVVGNGKVLSDQITRPGQTTAECVSVDLRPNVAPSDVTEASWRAVIKDVTFLDDIQDYIDVQRSQQWAPTCPDTGKADTPKNGANYVPAGQDWNNLVSGPRLGSLAANNYSEVRYMIGFSWHQ